MGNHKYTKPVRMASHRFRPRVWTRPSDETMPHGGTHPPFGLFITPRIIGCSCPYLCGSRLFPELRRRTGHVPVRGAVRMSRGEQSGLPPVAAEGMRPARDRSAAGGGSAGSGACGPAGRLPRGGRRTGVDVHPHRLAAARPGLGAGPISEFRRSFWTCRISCWAVTNCYRRSVLMCSNRMAPPPAATRPMGAASVNLTPPAPTLSRMAAAYVWGGRASMCATRYA